MRVESELYPKTIHQGEGTDIIRDLSKNWHHEPWIHRHLTQFPQSAAHKHIIIQVWLCFLRTNLNLTLISSWVCPSHSLSIPLFSKISQTASLPLTLLTSAMTSSPLWLQLKDALSHPNQPSLCSQFQACKDQSYFSGQIDRGSNLTGEQNISLELFCHIVSSAFPHQHSSWGQWPYGLKKKRLTQLSELLCSKSKAETGHLCIISCQLCME